MRLIKAGNESGISRAGLIFFLIVLGVPLYLGYRILPYFYNYYELVGLMDSQARVAAEYSDEKIREVLVDKIKDLNIPIKADNDLRIQRSGKFISMYLAYKEELWVKVGEKDYKLREFPFVAEVEREY